MNIENSEEIWLVLLSLKWMEIPRKYIVIRQWRINEILAWDWGVHW